MVAKIRSKFMQVIGEDTTIDKGLGIRNLLAETLVLARIYIRVRHILFRGFVVRIPVLSKFRGTPYYSVQDTSPLIIMRTRSSRILVLLEI